MAPIPQKIKVPGEKNVTFRPEKAILQKLEENGLMNAAKLDSENLLEKVKNTKITLTYLKGTLSKYTGFFIGQHQNSTPHGFIRFLDIYGPIYEGQAINGKIQGYGRLTFYDEWFEGWWNNGTLTKYKLYNSS